MMEQDKRYLSMLHLSCTYVFKDFLCSCCCCCHCCSFILFFFCIIIAFFLFSLVRVDALRMCLCRCAFLKKKIARRIERIYERSVAYLFTSHTYKAPAHTRHVVFIASAETNRVLCLCVCVAQLCIVHFNRPFCFMLSSLSLPLYTK